MCILEKAPEFRSIHLLKWLIADNHPFGKEFLELSLVPFTLKCASQRNNRWGMSQIAPLLFGSDG
jgi:hypothetical protein